MRISPDSRLVKYTYFIGDINNIPDQTTLCRFFWRFFFSSLFWLMLATLVGVYLSAWWTDTFKTFAVTAGILTFVGVLIAGDIIQGKYKAWKLQRPEKQPGPVKRILKEAFWGIKHRICPVIYIVPDGFTDPVPFFEDDDMGDDLPGDQTDEQT